MHDDFFLTNQATDTANIGIYFKYREGTDTGWTGTISAASPNGVVNILADAVTLAGSAAPTHGAGIVGLQGWRMTRGPEARRRLRMVARVKLDVYDRSAANENRACIFVGFTDQTAYEFPAYDTGGAGEVISAATDFIGFIAGSRTDTGWVAVAAKSTPNDSGDIKLALGANIVSNEWATLEIEVLRVMGGTDTGGVANFYVDGQLKGSIGSPVANNFTLYPCAYIFLEDTGGRRNLAVDYINVSSLRDTGD
jgi:hypothetical protein